jgi:hypothetical protein
VEFLIVLAAFLVVAWFVSAPLRGHSDVVEDRDAARRADLDAAKQAKYAEIRELEMDYRTGKLEEADFKDSDRRLRAEAMALLRQLDDLG